MLKTRKRIAGKSIQNGRLYACVLDRVIFPEQPEQCYDPNCIYLLELNRNDLDYLKRMGYKRQADI